MTNTYEYLSPTRHSLKPTESGADPLNLHFVTMSKRNRQLASALLAGAVYLYITSGMKSSPALDGYVDGGHPTTSRAFDALNNIIEQDRLIKHEICHENPYRSAIVESFEDVYDRAYGWIMAAEIAEKRAMQSINANHDHKRFFVFDEMAQCKNITCVGGTCSSDTSKQVCGLEELNRSSEKGGDHGCVIYSLGGNNQWEFERDALEKTNCQVHTFDCTGLISRFTKPNHERLHFHHVCLGTHFVPAPPPQTCSGNICGEFWTLDQMQHNLGHKGIDLLKIDIEGFEWPLFDSLETSTNFAMPMQMLMEVHYSIESDIKAPNHTHTNDKATDLVRFQTHLLKRGFVVVKRDDNPHCPHCTELTLMRIAC